MQAGTPLSVTVRDVAKMYDGAVALDGVSLDIRPGEFLTLLGPSGSGKTTLLNIIAGFLSPDRGVVAFGDRDVTALPPEKRGLGMVFQSYSLFPHMTVAENVAFPLRMRGVPRSEQGRRVAEALALVRLEGFANRKPGQLSGGQQQRVAFARSVVGRPGVLLMDEPLAALDLKLREAMQAEIASYRTAIGSTFIYVTHDQGEAMALSDRVAVMEGGRIRQLDAPEIIYDRPASRFVASFIGQANLLPAVRADGEVRLADCADTVRVADALPKDRPAFLCIRPEHMWRNGPGSGPSASGPAAPALPAPALPAVVTEVAFQGDCRRYTATTPSGARLLFAEPRGVVALVPGEAVTLHFDPARSVLVPDSQNSQPMGEIDA